MVLGIRHFFGFLRNHTAFFVIISIFPGPCACSRDFSGQAMLQERLNDLTVPVHGVCKREGNLCTHLASRRLHVIHPGFMRRLRQLSRCCQHWNIKLQNILRYD